MSSPFDRHPPFDSMHTVSLEEYEKVCRQLDALRVRNNLLEHQCEKAFDGWQASLDSLRALVEQLKTMHGLSGKEDIKK